MTNQPGSAPPGPHAVELIRRLRAWDISSWRHGERLAPTRAALDQLSALAARADGIPRPTVPDVGPHALADQLQVVLDDAQEAGADPQRINAVVAHLAEQLGLSPPLPVRQPERR